MAKVAQNIEDALIVPEKEFDICIVGSGPAAAFAAYELGQSGSVSVAVIEDGSDAIDMNPDHFIDRRDQTIEGKVDLGFSRQVGGASNLWAGGLAKYYQIDFLPREHFDLPGWPIEFDELSRYYQRVDAYVGVLGGEHSIHASSPPESNSELGEDFDAREMKVLHKPFNTKKLVVDVPGISLFKQCTAVRLVFKSSTPDEIDYLEIFDQTNKRVKKIRSQVFVIGAGTVSNVRLLLHSLSQRSASSSVLCQDNIGRYISTHPKADIGTLILFSPLDESHSLVGRFRENSHVLRYQFGLSLNLLLSHQLLNHCIRFDSKLVNRAASTFDKVAQSFDLIPFFGRHSDFLSKVVVETGVHIFRVLETIRHFGPVKGSLSVRGFFDQKPNRDNRITLSDNALEDGLPLGKIHWTFTEEDWENVDRFMQVCSDELRINGVGELHYQRPSLDEFTSVHSHFIGGTRMGVDPSNSVVDKNLKVHGVDNLYVSGPSVFPSYGYANPFYTISALSIRLGDHLKAQVDTL